MFNLDEAITQWRWEMNLAGIQRSEVLDELENHLRDDVRQQMASGVGAQPAFKSAVQKLGQAAALKNEFEIVQRRADFWWRRPNRVLICFTLVSLFLLVFLLFKPGNIAEMDPRQQLSGLLAVVATFLLGLCGWYGHGFFPVIHDRRMRDTLYISAASLGALWELAFLYLIVPRYDFNIAQLVLFFLWNWTIPFGLLAGFYFGIEKAAARRASLEINRLAFAGIPNHYTDMDNPSSNLDSRLATYLRSTIFLLPAVCFWMLAMVFVLPKAKELWEKSGASGVDNLNSFTNVARFDFAVMDLFKDNLFYIGILTIATLAVLEWRSRRLWPRFRRAVLGTGVFLLNLAVLASFLIMLVMATLAAGELLSHVK